MQRTLITNRARSFRKNMTEPEIMLWTRLRGRDPERPRFRRQHPIDSIIVDFFCPAARLAIEVDGSTHWTEESGAKDEARDRWLANQGIEVMRIPASWVYCDASSVAGSITERAVERAMEKSSFRPSPSTTGSSPGFTPGSAGGPPPPSRRDGGDGG